MQRRKISLIGSGNIGGSIAYLAHLQHAFDIVLYDINGSMARGRALDIAQAGAISGSDSCIIGTDDMQLTANSDVVIVTAGKPRMPGMSRDDLLSINSKIIQSLALQVKETSPNAFVIVVTNPLDVMVEVFRRTSGFASSKVVGMAGVLDAARMNHFIAEELNIADEKVHTQVLGGHGDLMVPLLTHSSVSGISLEEIVKQGLITNEKLQDIFQRTRFGGGEIVKLLGNGSAFYAPATAVLKMTVAYLSNSKDLLPCAAYLQGEYGHKNIYIGVPVVIGSNGVEKILELTLSADEQNQFDQSVKSVKSMLEAIND